MIALAECNARAVLCRRMAKLEPVSSYIWLAEAERWSRLAQGRLLAVRVKHALRQPRETLETAMTLDAPGASLIAMP
jgi:hypothetical protein